MTGMALPLRLSAAVNQGAQPSALRWTGLHTNGGYKTVRNSSGRQMGTGVPRVPVVLEALMPGSQAVVSGAAAAGTGAPSVPSKGLQSCRAAVARHRPV